MQQSLVLQAQRRPVLPCHYPAGRRLHLHELRKGAPCGLCHYVNEIWRFLGQGVLENTWRVVHHHPTEWQLKRQTHRQKQKTTTYCGASQSQLPVLNCEFMRCRVGSMIYQNPTRQLRHVRKNDRICGLKFFWQRAQNRYIWLLFGFYSFNLGTKQNWPCLESGHDQEEGRSKGKCLNQSELFQKICGSLSS